MEDADLPQKGRQQAERAAGSTFIYFSDLLSELEQSTYLFVASPSSTGKRKLF